MKKRLKYQQFISFVIVVAMAMTVFVGCGKKQTPSEPNVKEATNGEKTTSDDKPKSNTSDSTLDLSEKVNLVMYVTGTTPDNFDKIQEKLNVIALRDLNCTVTYNFFNSSDTQQKYMLLLSSGEQVDLIYSANWLNYSSYVAKGAFLELDEIVPNASPALWDYIGEDGWNAARVDGSIYMIPCMWGEYNLFGFTYREDLRKKHNLPTPDSIENIEAYLQGIKDNEPHMIPTGENVQMNSVANLGSYFRGIEVLDMKYNWVDWRMPYGIYIDYDDPTQTYNYWESANFREDMKLMKKWADAGFWSKNALSSTEDPKDVMLAGTVASQIGTSGYGAGVEYTREARQNDPNTEMEFVTVPYCYAKEQSVAVHPTQNGVSVPITAKHPERAVALYEKLMLDEEFFNLVQYGIEGEDYTVENNTYVEIPGGYGRESSRLWSARSDELYLPSGNWQDFEPFKQKFAEFEGPNKIGGFVEETTTYQAERAALMDVVTQYLIPIQAGMVSDVDASIDEFLDKARTAGM
ncbi:MAG TPA: extracellular solute-binding protein, partial [Clostridiales bacterium]|nr:extracellular solute-binding protein [Clostridiales bacterium]